VRKPSLKSLSALVEIGKARFKKAIARVGPSCWPGRFDDDKESREAKKIDLEEKQGA